MKTAISIIIAIVLLFVICVLPGLLKAAAKDNRCFICGKSIKEGRIACDECEKEDGTAD